MSRLKKSQEEKDLVDLIAQAVNAYSRLYEQSFSKDGSHEQYIEFIKSIHRSVHEVDMETFVIMLEDSQNEDMRLS